MDREAGRRKPRFAAAALAINSRQQGRAHDTSFRAVLASCAATHLCSCSVALLRGIRA
eukprot:CAMPEP_0179242120 /NCGR_PEP_ID=MMETSP0797-20121207/16849_1 /TAXON_ID=47934 /ORGANISM="Dinophysis acuminata, Strain DAEP01" /LENGTH=57 /DNA_ID=CAMNT_0020949537 /DNA_START=115 /DNA_END=284 /DNA_ORIENTATION=-